MSAGRLPIVVPRQAARGEHVDDHQAEIAERLSSLGLAVTADADDLQLGMLTEAASQTVHSAGFSSTLTLRHSRRRRRTAPPPAHPDEQAHLPEERVEMLARGGL
jgi:UDP-N-acetylglucosamine transferase subunit ALG13